jgi:hypothetical protein
MAMNPIDNLVEQLTPVRRLRPAAAWALVLGATALATAAIAARFGLRSDVMAGHPAGLVLLRGGVLLLLGSSALAALVAAARPGVGQTSHGWRWALGAALLYPLATLILSLAEGAMPQDELASASGPWCLMLGGGSGLAIGAALTLWLRQGATVALNRAGWLVGLAAGAFGTFAYSLHCPSETVQYAGIWYTAAVGLCALGARAIVPPLLRW